MRRYGTFKKPFLLRSDPQLLSLPLGLTTGPQLKTDLSVDSSSSSSSRQSSEKSQRGELDDPHHLQLD